MSDRDIHLELSPGWNRLILLTVIATVVVTVIIGSLIVWRIASQTDELLDEIERGVELNNCINLVPPDDRTEKIIDECRRLATEGADR